MAQWEKLGTAKREVVAAGVERLRVAYQAFIHEQQKAGVDFKFVDGQMIGHNFYKLVMWHIADEIAEQRPGAEKAEVRKELMHIAIETLRRALENPLSNETDPELS
jgi:methionine synthase II (cobalamin-independent)